jgi:hypothetical protein
MVVAMVTVILIGCPQNDKIRRRACPVQKTYRAGWADCGGAPSVPAKHAGRKKRASPGQARTAVWRRRTCYVAATRDLVGCGTTPSWRMRPRASQLTKPSTILPFEKRTMVTPVIANCFPVGAMPLSSPL